MTARHVAIVEWVLAGLLLIWFAIFLLTQSSSSHTLGLVITSLFFAPGLALSLVLNGLVHFVRRGRLSISELVLLGIEAVIILLLVLASVVDQSIYLSGALVPDLGHWFDWFVPLWVLIGPIALAINIVGLVKRRPSVPVAEPYAGSSSTAR